MDFDHSNLTRMVIEDFCSILMGKKAKIERCFLVREYAECMNFNRYLKVKLYFIFLDHHLREF
jgi:hypothetical protein